MKLESIGTVIGKREFEYNGQVVEVFIGMPQLFPEGEGITGFYYSPFEIRGLGEEDQIFYGAGPDSLGAIFGGVRMLEIALKTTQAGINRDLRWKAASFEGDLGFDFTNFED